MVLFVGSVADEILFHKRIHDSSTIDSHNVLFLLHPFTVVREEKFHFL